VTAKLNVTLLEPTGFFQYLAVWARRLSRGHPAMIEVPEYLALIQNP